MALDESKLDQLHDYIYDEDELDRIVAPADPPLRLEIKVPFAVGPSVQIEIVGPDVERIVYALRELGSDSYLENLLEQFGVQ